MTTVRYSAAGPIVSLQLDNPRHLNALSKELTGDLIDALHHAKSERCRVVVLRAAPGVTTWSAGHDVDELPTDGRDPLLWNSALEKLLRTVRSAPFPVIAAVEGGVWGGACDLVFACDMVVATTGATFAITPAKLGVPYNAAGVSHFLGVLPLHVIKEMFFTAQPISAQRAEQYGLVNRIADPAHTLTEVADDLAQQVARTAPLVVHAIKAEIAALTDASPLTPEVFEHLTALRRDAWSSADYAEGLASFHEHRPARFTGR